MTKVLMKGNEAIAKAAIKAGCIYFFGYPITPQNEIPEYMSRELPKIGGTFVQAESEVAAINMVYGCSATGTRCMTSSSSPGIALKQEGITYLAGARLPSVIVNIVRGGPGLGGIQPAQSDYFQATRGGGNGDYKVLVYAPSTLQETVDLVMDSFDKADEYRMPVMIIGDGMIGQMMEPVEFKEPKNKDFDKSWATTGTKNKRKPNIINSLYLDPAVLEEHNFELFRMYDHIKEKEVLSEVVGVDDCDVCVVSYGTTSRIVKNAIKECEKEGLKVGLIRPITLWPFPEKEFEKIGKNCKGILCVEMSMGQMIDDVKISVAGKFPVSFYGRTGGMIPLPKDIEEAIKKVAKGEK